MGRPARPQLHTNPEGQEIGMRCEHRKRISAHLPGSEMQIPARVHRRRPAPLISGPGQRLGELQPQVDLVLVGEVARLPGLLPATLLPGACCPARLILWLGLVTGAGRIAILLGLLSAFRRSAALLGLLTGAGCSANLLGLLTGIGCSAYLLGLSAGCGRSATLLSLLGFGLLHGMRRLC